MLIFIYSTKDFSKQFIYWGEILAKRHFCLTAFFWSKQFYINVTYNFENEIFAIYFYERVQRLQYHDDKISMRPDPNWYQGEWIEIAILLM